MSEIKPIIKLGGIRRELISKTDWMLVEMEQGKFDVLMEAANRCVQEAGILVGAGTLSKEAIKTIRKIISNWEDIRSRVIKDLARDSHPVIPRWEWNTSRREFSKAQ